MFVMWMMPMAGNVYLKPIKLTHNKLLTIAAYSLLGGLYGVPLIPN
jgi:hypothetical protein